MFSYYLTHYILQKISYCRQNIILKYQREKTAFDKAIR